MYFFSNYYIMSETKQETKVDKRKISSGKNLAKARQAKLDKLKQKKKFNNMKFNLNLIQVIPMKK